MNNSNNLEESRPNEGKGLSGVFRYHKKVTGGLKTPGSKAQRPVTPNVLDKLRNMPNHKLRSLGFNIFDRSFIKIEMPKKNKKLLQVQSFDYYDSCLKLCAKKTGKKGEKKKKYVEKKQIMWDTYVGINPELFQALPKSEQNMLVKEVFMNKENSRFESPWCISTLKGKECQRANCQFTHNGDEKEEEFVPDCPSSDGSVAGESYVKPKKFNDGCSDKATEIVSDIPGVLFVNPWAVALDQPDMMFWREYENFPRIMALVNSRVVFPQRQIMQYADGVRVNKDHKITIDLPSSVVPVASHDQIVAAAHLIKTSECMRYIIIPDPIDDPTPQYPNIFAGKLDLSMNKCFDLTGADDVEEHSYMYLMAKKIVLGELPRAAEDPNCMSHTQLILRATASMNKHFSKQTMNSIIVSNVLHSDWYYEKVREYNDTRRENRFDDFDKMMDHALRYSNYSKQRVICKARMRTAWKMTTSFLSSILIFGHFTGHADYFHNDFKDNMRLEAWEIANEKRLVFNFCSKILIQRQHCRNSNVDNVVSSTDKGTVFADYVEDDEDKYVENFGSTIFNVPYVLPSKDIEELSAALKIRMLATPEAFDVSDFVESSKNVLRKHFSGELQIGDRFTHLKNQYGEKRATRLMKLLHEIYSESKHGVCDLFVKDELYMGKTSDNYKPRMIWSRDPWFVAHFAHVFAAIGNRIQHDMGQLNGIYSSKLSPQQVGSVGNMIDMFASIFECDVSNWDGSFGAHFVELEQFFLQMILDVGGEDLDDLYSQWCIIHGKAYGKSRSDFLKVFLEAARRSGDLWTSCFNSLINYLIVLWVFECDPQSDDFIYMCLGDDGVGGINCPIDQDVVLAKYAALGMKCELIVRDSIFDATYCSGYFVPVNGQVYWANMPFRQFAKFGVNYHNHPESHFMGLLFGNAKGMLCTAGHMPIFQSFLRGVCNSAERRGITARRDNRDKNPFRHQGGMVIYPGMDTYQWFSEKYNIPLQVIFNYEEYLEHAVDIGDFPILFVDEFFRDGYSIDLNLNADEMQNDSVKVLGIDLWNDAMHEEIQKLHIAKSQNISPYQAGYNFGLEEVEMGGATYAPQVHGLWSFISSYNLHLGTAMHYYHNVCVASYLGVPLCNKKSLKKKKSKKNTKVAATLNSAQPKQGKKKKKKSQKSGWQKAAINLLQAGSSAVGSYLGGPIGEKLGSAVGGAISAITGHGDYAIRQNTLMNSAVTFGNGNIRVTNREFIGVVYSAINFTTVTYDINPGLATTFPWLSVLAQNYQRYDIQGLCFEFNSTAGFLTTTQAQGVIIMSTQYDANATPFVNRREMEAYVYTTSGIVTSSLLHCVECDPRERPLEEMYIRYGASADDLRFDDLGVMTMAIQGCPVADVQLGELWITYDVVLQMPRLEPHGYGNASWCHFSIGAYTNTDVFGTLVVEPEGTLECSIEYDSGNNTIAFPTLLDYGYYLVNLYWTGSSTASLTHTDVFTNCAEVLAWKGDTAYAVNSSGTADRYFYMAVIQITGRSATYKISSATLPSSGTYCDIYVAQISDPTSVSEVSTYAEALKTRGLWVCHPETERQKSYADFSTRLDLNKPPRLAPLVLTDAYFDEEEEKEIDSDLEEFRQFMRSKYRN